MATYYKYKEREGKDLADIGGAISKLGRGITDAGIGWEKYKQELEGKAAKATKTAEDYGKGMTSSNHINNLNHKISDHIVESNGEALRRFQAGEITSSQFNRIIDNNTSGVEGYFGMGEGAQTHINNVTQRGAKGANPIEQAILGWQLDNANPENLEVWSHDDGGFYLVNTVTGDKIVPEYIMKMNSVEYDGYNYKSGVATIKNGIGSTVKYIRENYGSQEYLFKKTDKKPIQDFQKAFDSLVAAEIGTNGLNGVDILINYIGTTEEGIAYELTTDREKTGSQYIYWNPENVIEEGVKLSEEHKEAISNHFKEVLELSETSKKEYTREVSMPNDKQPTRGEVKAKDMVSNLDILWSGDNQSVTSAATYLANIKDGKAKFIKRTKEGVYVVPSDGSPAVTIAFKDGSGQLKTKENFLMELANLITNSSDFNQVLAKNMSNKEFNTTSYGYSPHEYNYPLTKDESAERTFDANWKDALIKEGEDYEDIKNNIATLIHNLEIKGLTVDRENGVSVKEEGNILWSLGDDKYNIQNKKKALMSALKSFIPYDKDKYVDVMSYDTSGAVGEKEIDEVSELGEGDNKAQEIDEVSELGELYKEYGKSTPKPEKSDSKAQEINLNAEEQ